MQLVLLALTFLAARALANEFNGIIEKSKNDFSVQYVDEIEDDPVSLIELNTRPWHALLKMRFGGQNNNKEGQQLLPEIAALTWRFRAEPILRNLAAQCAVLQHPRQLDREDWDFNQLVHCAVRHWQLHKLGLLKHLAGQRIGRKSRRILALWEELLSGESARDLRALDELSTHLPSHGSRDKGLYRWQMASQLDNMPILYATMRGLTHYARADLNRILDDNDNYHKSDLFDVIENEEGDNDDSLGTQNMIARCTSLPLYLAASSGLERNVKALIAEKRLVSPKHRRAALVCAASRGDTLAVRVLLSNGVKPCGKHYGTTPIAEAQRYKHERIIQLLSDHGCR